jgi:hypothetical protein
MRKCTKLVVHGTLLAVAFFLGITQSATAKVIRWELQNVKFVDGGSAHGFFVFDPDTAPDPYSTIGAQPLVAWDITVEGTGEHPCKNLNDCFPDYRFSAAEGGHAQLAQGLLIIYSHTFYDLDPTGRIQLRLTLGFDPPLSNAGGSLNVGGFEYWGYTGQYSRDMTSGQVVAVPESSQALFLAVCLIGVVGLRTAQALKRGMRVWPR